MNIRPKQQELHLPLYPDWDRHTIKILEDSDYLCRPGYSRLFHLLQLYDLLKFSKTYQLRGDGDTATNLSSFDVWYITSTQTIYTDVYESTQLSELSNIYRHNTDLSIIIAAGIYALNIIDAVVDAHLFHFDVSDDLSMNVQPFYVPPVMGVARGGLTLTLTMK